MNREEMEACLQELDEELARVFKSPEPTCVLVVSGACLLLAEVIDRSTKDIDVIITDLEGTGEATLVWNLTKYACDQLFATDALLLGRVTYQGFAKAWPSMTDEQGFADRMNSLPKFVVSTTLESAEWNNARLIKENIVEEISKLKQQPGQDILIYGSGNLVHTLMQHNIIDEYRIWVHPVVVGSGKRLFRDEGNTTVLRLVETKTFSSGVVVLLYQSA